jgi:hypothetical protein
MTFIDNTNMFAFVCLIFSCCSTEKNLVTRFCRRFSPVVAPQSASRRLVLASASRQLEMQVLEAGNYWSCNDIFVWLILVLIND